MSRNREAIVATALTWAVLLSGLSLLAACGKKAEKQEVAEATVAEAAAPVGPTQEQKSTQCFVVILTPSAFVSMESAIMRSSSTTDQSQPIPPNAGCLTVESGLLKRLNSTKPQTMHGLSPIKQMTNMCRCILTCRV